jgi:hypothetical protein
MVRKIQIAFDFESWHMNAQAVARQRLHGTVPEESVSTGMAG